MPSTPVRARRRLGIALVAIAALTATTLSGCVPQPADSAPIPATAADARWGQAPQQVAGVTLQPDVVIIGGGASSVEQVTSDGMTWVLKRSAPNLDRLKVGSVMFVTGSGVGRVINLKTVRDQVGVTIAPVSITDIVRDGTFSVPKPVPLGSNAVALGDPSILTDPTVIDKLGQDDPFTDPTGPDVPSVLRSSPTQAATVEPTAFGGGARMAGAVSSADLPIPSPAIPPLPDGIKRTISTGGEVAQQISQQQGDFQLGKSIKPSAFGTHFTYNGADGLRMVGDINLTTNRPTADFQLKISDGVIRLAEFRIQGAGALHASIVAATQPGHLVTATSRWLGEGMQFQIPIGLVGGLPLSVFVSNQVRVQVRLPGGSSITGAGDFSLDASLGFRYTDTKKFESLTGGHFNAKTSADKSDSLSVGIAGATLWDFVNFRVGIGFLSFSAGLDFSIDMMANIDMGAPIAFNPLQTAADPIEKCRRVHGYLGGAVGVGVTIPDVIRKVVDWFGSIFGSPPIPKNLSIRHPFKASTTDQVFPDSGFCK